MTPSRDLPWRGSASDGRRYWWAGKDLSIGVVARRVGLSVLFLLSLVTGCGSDEKAEDSRPRVERAPEITVVIGEGAPVTVGVSAPITGADARTGTEDRDAVIAAVARWKEANGATIKGHEIEVLAEDDGCTEADIAAEAARRLAAQPTVVGVVANCSAAARRRCGSTPMRASPASPVRPRSPISRPISRRAGSSSGPRIATISSGP